MKMPKLGFGTFRLEGDVAFQSTLQALTLGYRHIDTAQIYGNEAEVGKAWKASGVSRDEVFITTKVWNDNLAPEKLAPSVQESLEKLQTDRVDLLLVHWPAAPGGVSMDAYLSALYAVKEAGLTQHIGVSNFTVPLLKQAMEILPQGALYTNQVEIHPLLQNNTLRAFCEANHIMLTSYMPFAVGLALRQPDILALAEKKHCTPAQVVIAWHLQSGFHTIPSSTKKENMAANLQATSVKLSADEMRVIDALDANERQAAPDFSPKWDV